MKYKFLLLCFLFNWAICAAQKKAVTDTGEEVILYENGTWKYANDFRDPKLVIKTNPVEFKKSTNATFLLKSKTGDIGFWIDPKKWTFGKATNNTNAEYELSLKEQSVECVIIIENIEVPLPSLKKIAVENAKTASPDYHILLEEYRTVNGLKVLYTLAQGTVSDVKFYFKAYYYSGDNIAVQFLLVGPQKSMAKDQKEADELLNGIVSTNPAKSIHANAELNDDSLSQGLLSPNNNCKIYFDGKWEYNAHGKNVLISRNRNKTTERIGNYSYEYENKWLNNCEYEMIFRKTSQPNYKLEKIGEIMKVSILAIDKDLMKYEVVYRGNTVQGEMVRSKN